MSWFSEIFKRGEKAEDVILRSIQTKFSIFVSLLDRNNEMLQLISDMEEKSQGEYLFDINYIRTSIDKLSEGVKEIVGFMIALGGEKYSALKERRLQIMRELENIIHGDRPIPEDDYTIPLEKLNRENHPSVGSKNAQLAEMRNRLSLPAPEGFAISAYAYKRFVDHNQLQTKIDELIKSIDIKNYEDLQRVSSEIWQIVNSSPVPDDLCQSIQNSYNQLKECIGDCRIALRSSAIGEDTIFSFAGQYATFLNVKSDEIIDKYREVIAGKFTPQAIYYFLSHALTESELAMSVGCVSMVDAVASGVIYTLCPVMPEENSIVINSVCGLGRYLVDGVVTPDTFRMSKEDFSIKSKMIVAKGKKLVIDEQGELTEEKIPKAERRNPSITEEQAVQLAKYAAKIEEHYGTPQDIEWSIDRDGRIFMLQTRPLRIIKSDEKMKQIDTSGLELITNAESTVCPGVGCGPVCHVSSSNNLRNIPNGAVLVAPHPFPGLVTAMGKISALILGVGGIASHTAAIAREYRIPSIVGIEDDSELIEGMEVTVDAVNLAVYRGVQEELIAALRESDESFYDMAIFALLERVLKWISPLTLIDSTSDEFSIENSKTLHDIIRYCHQKAMEEMFSEATTLKQKAKYRYLLKTDIPLIIRMLYVDRGKSELPKDKWIKEEAIDSIPMVSFWRGVKQEGWPTYGHIANPKKFRGMVAAGQSKRGQYSEESFAILSREYMNLSLRMGYHFMTIEAMCSPQAPKNYVRMQFKAGGAAFDRRKRRIHLLETILEKIGFVNEGKEDFLNSVLSYQAPEKITEKLYLLGRLTMLTKQLDMALSNDPIAQWYIDEFSQKLNL
ncbi:MAG: hypothetical protein GF315_07500 [candidate division Zixibacteria bacterium]|nr:hypothetical protein [candidate division Zixibacteria bacterium]